MVKCKIVLHEQVHIHLRLCLVRLERAGASCLRGGGHLGRRHWLALMVRRRPGVSIGLVCGRPSGEKAGSRDGRGPAAMFFKSPQDLK